MPWLPKSENGPSRALFEKFDLLGPCGRVHFRAQAAHHKSFFEARWVRKDIYNRHPPPPIGGFSYEYDGDVTLSGYGSRLEDYEDP